MKPSRRTMTAVSLLVISLLPCQPSSWAQTPIPPAPNQSGGAPAASGPPPGPGLTSTTSSSASPPSTASSTTAVVSAPTTGTMTGSGKLSPSVGQRLPGMGGAPLSNPMGAGNPTPPMVDPLSCDLVADPACM